MHGHGNSRSISSIAREIGATWPTVRKHLNKPEVRDLIEQESNRYYVSNLPKAVDIATDIIHKKPKDYKEKKLQYDAVKDVLQGARTLPSSGESTYVQQIFQQNNLVPPEWLMDVLKKHVKSMTFEGNIDATPIEETQDGKDTVHKEVS